MVKNAAKQSCWHDHTGALIVLTFLAACSASGPTETERSRRAAISEQSTDASAVADNTPAANTQTNSGSTEATANSSDAGGSNASTDAKNTTALIDENAPIKSTLRKPTRPTKVIIGKEIVSTSGATKMKIFSSDDQQRAYCFNNLASSNLTVWEFNDSNMTCENPRSALAVARTNDGGYVRTGWDPLGERLAVSFDDQLWVLDLKNKTSKSFKFPSSSFQASATDNSNGHGGGLIWSNHTIVGWANSENRASSNGQNGEVRLYTLNVRTGQWQITKAPEKPSKLFAFDGQILIFGQLVGTTLNGFVTDLQLSPYRSISIPWGLYGSTQLAPAKNGKVKFIRSGGWQYPNLLGTYDIKSASWPSLTQTSDTAALIYGIMPYFTFGLNSTFFAGAMIYDNDEEKFITLPVDGSWRMEKIDNPWSHDAFWFKGRGYFSAYGAQLNAAGPFVNITMIYTP